MNPLCNWVEACGPGVIELLKLLEKRGPKLTPGSFKTIEQLQLTEDLRQLHDVLATSESKCTLSSSKLK